MKCAVRCTAFLFATMLSFPVPARSDDALRAELAPLRMSVAGQEVEGLSARLSDNGPASVGLFFPLRYSEPAVVSSGGVRVALRPVGARLARAEAGAGTVTYRAPYPDTDVRHVLGRDRSEEFLYLRSPKAPSRFEYEIVEMDGAAQVVLREGEIRFLAEGGGSLRIERPYVIDAAGRRSDTAARWELVEAEDGRRVVLRVDDAGLEYPLLVDPSWSATSDMASSRARHTATLLPDGRVLVAGGDTGIPLAKAEVFDPASGAWSVTGSLASPRYLHTATLLPTGKVLVTGGYNYDSGGGPTASAELYDPVSGTWTTTGALAAKREDHTATLLPSGKVLVAGGNDNFGNLATAELYDPATGTWTTTGPLATGRYAHTALQLPNGKVLVAGGFNGGNLDSAELYDPTSGTWTAAGSLLTARSLHTATLLASGKVLVAGGLPGAELFDPASGTWTATGSPVGTLAYHTATLLPSGKVLAAGGYDPGVELYDPATGTWTATVPLATRRDHATATLLPSGRVLVAGGSSTTYFASVELYDPTNGTWTSTGSLANYRSSHTATLLPGGKVLAAGGYNGSVLASAELYNPSTGTWTATGSLTSARYDHSATLLPNGRVLVAGGYDASQAIASAELYDPASGTWTATGSLFVPRYSHTATLLPSGQVLVAGGGTDLGYLASAEIYDPATGTWTTTGSLADARGVHTATLLATGQVLVAGGGPPYAPSALSAELYDPASATWTATGSLRGPRTQHTATLLPSGKVLVAGGYGGLVSVDLYDPASGTWTATGSLAAGRTYHTATLLASGQVLIAGGDSLGQTEVYEPATGTWAGTGALPRSRSGHTATLLLNGQVLLAGGDSFDLLYDLGTVPVGRGPVVTSAPATLSYGAPFAITGTGFRGDSEASGGGTNSSAVNYPLVQVRSLLNDQVSWLRPDPRTNFWDDPMTLTFSTLPTTLMPGSSLLTVIVDGNPSVPRAISLGCGVVITQQPIGQVVPIGGAATFTVTTQGARSFQWQKDGIPILGATNPSYSTPPVTGADSGSQYRVEVQGVCRTAGDTTTSTPATLTVADSTPPTATVLSPSGGEYWLLSESGAPPLTQLVSWTMSDDVRVCQVAVSLFFSNDGGAAYQAAPAGGGLPATLGSGGSCAYPGVTTSNLAYSVPTAFPSGASGSLYKIELSVTDQVGHITTVRSPNPFYIVRANPDSVRTLVLANPSRMQALGMDTTVLAGKLQELAANPKVQGLVVDLGGVTALSSLYAAWDADSANATKANDVLFAANGVHDYLRTLLLAYTGVKYVILVGDDRVIPMARVADHTTLLSESSYPDGVNLTPTGTTVGQALAANKYLSDDPLAVLDAVASNQLSGNLYIPDLAIGRLVESPAQITQAIATFISQDGVADLSVLDPSTGHKVLVTGYDFLEDSAKRVRDRWKTALGACTTCNPDPAPVDGSLISDTWGVGSVSQRVAALQTRMCGAAGAPYALISLSGHATHFEEGVPGTDPFDIVGLDTSLMTDPNACGAGIPLDLSGAVVYAVGCHGGLPVGGSAPADHPLDLPETLLSRGAVAYVANTGYGWGLRNGIGYGERLEELLSEELTKGGTVVVGDAVKRVKQRYYLETPRYDSYDEKSLMQWTLFGLPMYAVKTGIPTGSRPSLVNGRAPSALERPAFEELGRVTVERTQQSLVSQPDYLTQINLHFNFTATGLYRKWTAAGDEVLPITLACPDLSGCYYTLNSLADRATGAGDLPVQPYLIYDSRLAGTSQHGVLWKGGTYDEETNWIPVVGELVSNGGDGSDHGSAPRLMFTRPVAPRLVPGLDPSTCRPSDLELNSLTVPAGEALKNQDVDPSYTIERHYRTIDLEALYFNNTAALSQNCDRTGPALGPGPFAGAYHQVSDSAVEWAVPASDPSGVWRVLVVSNDNATIGGQGVWSPLELTNDGSGTWVGSRTFGITPRITYVIQAVDNRGNVTWLDYVAAQPPASGVPLGVPAPVDVGIGAPVGPTVAGLTPSKGPVGITVRINGTNLAGATDVTFGGVSAVITANTASLITAVVPVGAVTGPVGVTTLAGSTSSAMPFMVIPPPKLSITDVRVREGNSGQRNAVFRVTLSAPSSQPVTVQYATADGTATTAGNDYASRNGTLTFPRFVRVRAISVPIFGDAVPEGNESFVVTLSSPANATITRAQGRGTIVDDDGP